MLLTMISLLQVSCKSEKDSEVSLLDLLVGEWTHPEISREDRTFIEEWSKSNDTTYIGRAYAINLITNDIFNTEELSIEFRNNNWVYKATPSGQTITSFRMSELTPEHMRFENPKHDFPKYIEYRWSSPDSLVASIGDTSRSMKFPMVRIAAE